MFNEVASSTNAPSVATAPYAVDVSKGSVRGDVASQWAARPSDQRFDTLSELYDFKKDVHDRSLDIVLNTNQIEFFSPAMPQDGEMPGATQAEVHAEANRRMAMLSVGFSFADGSDVQQVREVSPSHWAFGQLASLAKAPAGYLRSLPTMITADSLNWGMKFVREVEQVKLYADAESLMAAQGPDYGRIPDHEVIAALMQIAGDGKGEDMAFHWKAPGRLNWQNGTYDPEALGPKDDRTFYGSDRDMFCFLVDDRRPINVGKTRDGGDDLMFRGFYVQNSMVGSRSLKLATFYLRGVCMNRNLWGVEEFQEITVRHTKGAPARWLNEMQPALESYANASDSKLIEGVERAKAKVLADTKEGAINFLKNRAAFSTAAATRVYEVHEKEEGKPMRSVWDFAQGITANARAHRNTDDRLADELKAKAILDSVI